ncbi:TIGR02391 family protein, partial [Candidatus Microgenomates bacterium]|nr:TIGR02391 family protein [Candidatus Microgenomates bacterium]
MKKLDYTKENLRLLASIIAKATSGSLFTKLLIDAGWTPNMTYNQLYREAGKNKEDYLHDEFIKIGENGREDILDYLVEKTLSKSSVYFKQRIREYKFPRDQFSLLKKKLKVETESKPKINERLFKDRNLHKSVVFVSKKLFIDGHYSQSIFEACKLLENTVKKKSGLNLNGVPLMQQAFSPHKPILKLNLMSDQAEVDEQTGFMLIYSGVMQGIRDPKGHSIINLKDREKALEYF